MKTTTKILSLLAIVALVACEPKDADLKAPAGEDHLTDTPITLTVGAVGETQGAPRKTNAECQTPNLTPRRAGYTKGELINSGSLTFWIDQPETKYDAKHLEINYQRGEWVSMGTLIWRNGTDVATYAAVYPHQTNSNGIYNITVPTEQTNENIKATEILYATGTAKGEDGAINIVFEHTLAQLKVNLTFGETVGTAVEVKSVRLSNAALSGTFTAWNDNHQCEWSNPSNSGDVTLIKNSNTEFECLLVPQTLTDYTIDVVAEVNGAQKTYRFYATTPITLEQGATYSIPVQVGASYTPFNSTAAGTIAANPALLDSYLSNGTLTITGSLNDADMVALGEWAIRNANDGTDGNDVLYLDLSGVTGITATPQGMFYKALDGTYQGTDLLKEIILPISVTRLGKNSFMACDGLEKITAEGVEYVEEQAVSLCPALTTFVGSKIQHIELSGFIGCTSLKSLDLSNLESTGGLVFQDTQFESFYAPKLKKVEDSLFAYSTLSGITIDLPACTELGNRLFHHVEGDFTLRLTTKDDITLTDTTFGGGGENLASAITLYLHENKMGNLPEYLDWYTFKAIHYVDDAGNVVP